MVPCVTGCNRAGPAERYRHGRIPENEAGELGVAGGGEHLPALARAGLIRLDEIRLVESIYQLLLEHSPGPCSCYAPSLPHPLHLRPLLPLHLRPPLSVASPSPLQSDLIQSNLIQSNPIQSNPIQSNPINSNNRCISSRFDSN